jgi:tetratricopeptide (TPR) repeat protein
MGRPGLITNGIALAVLLGAGGLVVVTFLPAGGDGDLDQAADVNSAPSISFTRLAEPPVAEQVSTADSMVQELLLRSIAEVRADPEDPDAWLTLALAYHANDILADAAPCYETTIALAPDSPYPRYWLAVCLYRLGQTDEAIAMMQTFHEMAPSYSPGQWRYGEWLLESGDIGGAEQAYRRSIEADPQDAAGWYGLADIYVRTDEPEKAIQIIEDRLLAGPYSPYVRQLYARALRSIGEVERAEVEFSRSSPGETPWDDRMMGIVTDFWTGRAAEMEWGRRLIGNGRGQEAAARLEGVLEHFPDDIQVLNNLGVAYGSAEMWESAIVPLRRARELAPDDPLTNLNLAKVEYNRRVTGAPDAESALELVNRSIELDPNRADAYDFLSYLYERSLDYENAIIAMQKAADRSPQPIVMLIHIADLYGQLGDFESAERSLRRAMEVAPGAVGAYSRLIIIFANQGRIDEADELLAKATRILNATGDPRLETARDAVEQARRGELTTPIGPSP